MMRREVEVEKFTEWGQIESHPAKVEVRPAAIRAGVADLTIDTASTIVISSGWNECSHLLSGTFAVWRRCSRGGFSAGPQLKNGSFGNRRTQDRGTPSNLGGCSRFLCVFVALRGSSAVGLVGVGERTTCAIVGMLNLVATGTAFSAVRHVRHSKQMKLEMKLETSAILSVFAGWVRQNPEQE